MQYNFFKKSGIPYSLQTIYVGWKLGIISPKDVEMFAEEYFLLHPEIANIFFAELAFDASKQTEIVLKKALESTNTIITENSPEWDTEVRKWRYAILQSLRQRINDPEKLLHKIEEVYADFSYPEEMENFIYYMPSENPPSSKNDGIQKLIKQFEAFLEKEKLVLNNQ